MPDRWEETLSSELDFENRWNLRFCGRTTLWFDLVPDLPSGSTSCQFVGCGRARSTWAWLSEDVVEPSLVKHAMDDSNNAEVRVGVQRTGVLVHQWIAELCVLRANSHCDYIICEYHCQGRGLTDHLDRV
jgi:hypothetical protein